jgi:hypothetical protein
MGGFILLLFHRIGRKPMNEEAIGQTEGKSERKCPIEGVYWTNRKGREKREEMSDREGLLDKKKGKA